MLCCALCLLFFFTFFELCPNDLSCVILIVGLFVVVGVSVVFSWLLLALAFALDGPAVLTWTYCCFFSFRILLKAIPFLAFHEFYSIASLDCLILALEYCSSLSGMLCFGFYWSVWYGFWYSACVLGAFDELLELYHLSVLNFFWFAM